MLGRKRRIFVQSPPSRHGYRPPWPHPRNLGLQVTRSESLLLSAAGTSSFPASVTSEIHPSDRYAATSAGLNFAAERNPYAREGENLALPLAAPSIQSSA